MVLKFKYFFLDFQIEEGNIILKCDDELVLLVATVLVSIHLGMSKNVLSQENYQRLKFRKTFSNKKIK